MFKINHRLKKLEQRLLQSDDGAFTLEEFCRAMWISDKKHFWNLQSIHRLVYSPSGSSLMTPSSAGPKARGGDLDKVR
jgi:hypothetical protein